MSAGDNGAFELNDQQRLAWLRLIRSENVGPATFRDLINHFGSASAAIEALPELSRRGGRSARIKICPPDVAAGELEATERLGGRIVAMGERGYPPYLQQADYPPPMLSVRGDSSTIDRPTVGIVGARNASLAGVKLAAAFAKELGSLGYTIVSGYARGIDIAAHKASADSGTVAVFAGGIDAIFPPEHVEFTEEFLARGNSIISEMPLGWRPRAKDFPRRNRIIAGVSLGVVVIEAAQRSGSLITARLANEAGRLVFAVPGSPLDPRSAGTNILLKRGAQIATSAQDVEEAVRPLTGLRPPPGPQFGETPDEAANEDELARASADIADAVRQAVTSALGPTPVEVDEIIRYTGASAGEVQLVLIELDLAGRLERHAGNRVSLV